MPEPRLIRELTLAPDQIELGDRLRPVTEAGVATLIASIDEKGFTHPVDVREIAKRGDTPKRFVLIAGATRIAACVKLGREVPVRVWHCTNDQAALMEIDDQITGSGMTELDNAIFLARRKATYERLHPEAASNAFRGNRHTGKLESGIMPFTRSAAERMGCSKTKVERLLRIGSTLSNSEINDLRSKEKPLGFNDLLAIAKIGEAQERSQVCQLLARGDATTVSAALKLAQGLPAPVKDPVEDALKDLLERFDRAPMEAKRRFVAMRLDDLTAAGFALSLDKAAE